MESRESHRAAAGLEAAGERGDQPAAAPSAGNRWPQVIAGQPVDQLLRQLDRATCTPGLSRRAEQSGPGAYEVVHPAVEVHRVQAAFRGDVEMVSDLQAIAQLASAGAGAPDRLLVARRQPEQRAALPLLRHHGHRHRSLEAVVEEAQEPVAHTEQPIGTGARHGDLDARLEAVPELLKITRHDYEPTEQEDQGYSPPPAK